MKRFLLILAAVFGVTAHAGDIITATVVITTPANLTNDASITLNGSDTRIWTNSVTTPATQIRSSTTAANAAFNLLQHLRAYPFTDVSVGHTNNGVVLIGEEGDALALTITNSWATVAYRTNTVGTTGEVVRVPPTAEESARREDIANYLKDWLELATEAIDPDAPIFADFAAASDDQTAAEVPVTPAGNIAANDVQEALEELDNEKAGHSRIDNTAYDATSWNGSTNAPTKDAVRDKIEALVLGGGLGSSDIDTSAELRGIVTDETGTGALVFAGGDVGAATATTASAADNDTSVATTAFVQGEKANPTLTSAIVTLNGTADGLTDDTYDGITITGRNAGETVAQWELVRFHTDNEFHLADADAAGEFPARGIAVAASTDGNAITVLVQGIVRNDGWAWGTIGGPIYLSDTAGGLTQTAPSTSGDAVQIVGWALSDDEAYLNFSGHWVEAP